MKSILSLIVILIVCLSFNLASAHNKAVIIPLNTVKNLDNIVTVSKRGGDFSSLHLAIASITDASESNPYLVLVGPGVYTLSSNLEMKEYVSIYGAGQNITILQGSISTNIQNNSSAVISGADNATLAGLTVTNNGGAQYSIAISNRYSSPRIENVTANATGGTSLNFGIYNYVSSAIMNNVTASASGGAGNRGILNSSSSTTMINVIASANDGTGENHGIYNYYSSETNMTNVTASASNSTSWDIGLRIHNSSFTVRHCTLKGDNYGIYNSGSGTSRVMQSSIIGGVGSTGGILTCVNSDNGVSDLLNGTCH